MVIYQRWAIIDCPQCGYKEPDKREDLSEYQYGKQGFKCPQCNYLGWSKLVGIPLTREETLIVDPKYYEKKAAGY